MGFQLAAHQRYASSMMDWTPALAIFYEAGTGKTATALDFLYRAVQRGEITSALVICPASIVGSWISSVDKMLQFDGYTQEGVQRLKEVLEVVSYQKTYSTRTRKVKHRNGEVSKATERRLRDEVNHPWDCIIVDESHNIGTHGSQQTEFCLKLGRMAKRRYIMTGTPVSGGGGHADYQKLYGQIKFLNDSEYRTWTEFKEKYVALYGPFNQIEAYREGECNAIMQKYGIVARLADCYDMPTSTDTVIPCSLAEPKVYKDLEKGAIADYNIDIRSAGTIHGKLRQVCSGSLKTEDGIRKLKTSKTDALKTIIEGTDDKIVVFCQFRESIDQAAEVGAKSGRIVSVFDGRSKGETWREFQFGASDMLVCQYQAGGVGLDLFASATMVLYEPTYSALLLEQTRARIMRKGQTRSCRYIYLTTPDTVEDDSWNCVRNGMDLSIAVMDWLNGLRSGKVKE